MGKDSLSIGAKPRRPRVVNFQNDPPRQAQVGENQIRQAVEDPGGEFGDGTSLSKDWRLIHLIICEVIKQSGDLVQHLKPESKNKGKKYSYLALSNLKDALKHMKSKGLLKIKSSGRTTPGSDVGNKEKWEFETMQNVGVGFIKTKVDASPVGIVFDLDSDFFGIKKGIYTVRGTKMVEGENEKQIERHMLIIVGYGYTKEGKLFFVVQNSWGKDKWGVQGYGRIIIDDNSNFVLIFPSYY